MDHSPFSQEIGVIAPGCRIVEGFVGSVMCVLVLGFRDTGHNTMLINNQMSCYIKSAGSYQLQ